MLFLFFPVDKNMTAFVFQRPANILNGRILASVNQNLVLIAWTLRAETVPLLIIR